MVSKTSWRCADTYSWTPAAEFAWFIIIPTWVLGSLWGGFAIPSPVLG
jgi:hypothetical protein